ncbi:MAG: ATP-grasp domain-containing protein [Bacteroidales bacterium]|nr:ATP-grasp domain-containing protein [Bacteroidales bacterium]
MKQKVVIIGQGFTGRLSIVRSVAELECDVTLIVLTHRDKASGCLIEDKPIDAYSKYVNRTIYCETYNAEMLVEILLTKCVNPNQKSFIFPDNDFSAAAIDNSLDLLKEHFYCPNINDEQGAIAEWMNKVRQKKLAQEVGLNVAKTNVIEIDEGIYIIPDKIEYPCFVKPLASIIGGKYGLKKCNNKEELDRHLKRLPTLNERYRNIKLLVEDFKTIDKEFAVLGFSDGKQVVVPGVIQILHLAHGTHFGVAVQGKISTVDDICLIEKFSELIKRIGFVGIFDIDYYESDGIIYFGEINMRFGGSGYAYTKTGVNLPALMIKSFLGQTIEGINCAVTQTATFFNERMAIDDWYNGYLSTKDYYRLRNTSQIRFIEDENDPQPQKVFVKEFRKKLIRKTIKLIFGR